MADGSRSFNFPPSPRSRLRLAEIIAIPCAGGSRIGRALLVIDQGCREPQTGVQGLLERVVLTAVGVVDLRKITGLYKVHKCLPACRLPSLNVDVLAVVAGAQRITLDLWLHSGLLADSAMLAGSRESVNGALRWRWRRCAHG